MFYSDKFVFNDIYSEDYSICLVSQEDNILNEHGIHFSKDSDDTNITLSFCYVDAEGNPMEWTHEVLTRFLEWMITEDYCKFISEDNENIVYFLKGVEYTKRFTNAFTGLIDITFKSLSPFGYKYTKDTILTNETNVEIYNYSNSDNKYKPLITITDIASENVSIKNNTTNKEAFELYGTLNKEIYVDGKMGTIQDSENNNLINESNRKWIELCKGVNEISVEGICTLTIEAYYPMMV